MTPERRILGGTGVELSTLGLGCAPLAGLQAPVTDEDARETLDTAWAAGARYYDTSPWYGRGLSELRLGERLRSQPRESYVLSTKVGRTFHRPCDAEGYRSQFWAGGLPFEHRFDYTYDGLMRSYEQSLMRLGLNTIDLLLIHDLDIAEIGSADLVAHHLTDLERSGWRALRRLRDEGEIRGVGAGVNITGTIPAMLDRFDLDFFLVAMPYTLLDQAIARSEFPRCAERGVGLVIGSPYASGILATGSAAPRPYYNYEPAPPAVVDRVRRLESVCGAHGVPLKAAAIQFPLRHPLVASVISGAVSAEQVADNAAMARMEIPQGLWADLKDEGLIDE